MNVCGFVLALIVWRLEITFSPAAKRAADELPPWNALHWFRPALSQTLASPIGYLALNYINFPMLVKLDVEDIFTHSMTALCSSTPAFGKELQAHTSDVYGVGHQRRDVLEI